MRHSSFKSSRVGVLLLDGNLLPLYYNAEAASILSYPKKRPETLSLDALLPATRSSLSRHCLRSGRRRYRCRAFLLDSNKNTGGRGEPRFVVVLDRDCTQPVDIKRWSEGFQLTSRERETVTHLLRGLSSKQIAAEMRISPSTVKSFLKLVMAKVGAATRAEIVAKIVEGASLRLPKKLAVLLPTILSALN